MNFLTNEEIVEDGWYMMTNRPNKNEMVYISWHDDSLAWWVSWSPNDEVATMLEDFVSEKFLGPILPENLLTFMNSNNKIEA